MCTPSTQPSAVRSRETGVVQILGVPAVDSEQRQGPQILPPLQLFGGEAGFSEGLRLGEDLLREDIGDAPAVDDGVGAAFGAVRRTVDGQDAGGPVPLLVPLDGKAHLIPRHGAADGGSAHRQRVAEAAVRLYGEAIRALARQAAGEQARAGLQHLDDRALGTAGIGRTDPDGHRVAGQGVTQVASGDEAVLPRFLQAGEAEAFVEGQYPAPYAARRVGQGVPALFALGQLPVPFHLLQGQQQAGTLRFFQPHQGSEHLRAQGLFRPPEMADHPVSHILCRHSSTNPFSRPGGMREKKRPAP